MIHLAKVKHDMIMKYLINETGPKNTVENIKHLKVQIHLTNSKYTAVMTCTQKIQIFKIRNPKKYSSYS